MNGEIEKLVALIHAEEDRQFEESIASRLPIEKLVLRRVRERLSKIAQDDFDAWEQVILHGDGSSPPTGVFRA